MHHRDFVSLRHKALPVTRHSGKSHIRVLLSTCCMLADCLHGCLSLCMINAHNVFLFFPFSLFVEIIEPTTSSPVTSPGQYPHTFTKYVWVLLPSTRFSHCHRNTTSCFWAPVMGVALVSLMCSVLQMCSHIGSCVWCLTCWWRTSLLYVVGSASHLKPCKLIRYALPTQTEWQEFPRIYE